MQFERQRIDPQKITPVLRHKWSDTILDEGFVPFPKRLLRCTNKLFRGAGGLTRLKVVLSIIDCRRPNQNPPSIQYLAFIAGIKVTRLKKTLDDLEELGYIRVTEKKGRFDINCNGLFDKIVDLTTEREPA